MNYSNETLSVAQRIISNEVVTGFRSMFYLFTPSETSYSSVKEVPHFVDKAPPYFISLIFIEFLLLYYKGKRKDLPRWNDLIASISAGTISLLPLLVMRNIELSTYVWVHENYCLFDLPWNSPWTWILALFGVDMGYYWVHRFAHEINFMWAGHQTHHSSEDYNLATAIRQGVFQKYSSWIFYCPLAFFLPPSVFYVHIQFNLLYQFWIHTLVIDKLPGPVEFFMNTPSHHRVHHGINRYCIDKNYAGVFIIWDRMFGTFAAEQKTEEIAYGLVHQVNSWNPIYIQLSHWMHLLKTFWHTEGITNKVAVMFKGPGWTPGKPRLGLLEDIPDARAPVVKFDKNVSNFATAYSLFQHIVTFVTYDTLTKNKHEMSTLSIWCGIFFILHSFVNIGFFLEGRSFAKLSELIRWVVILVVHSIWCIGESSIAISQCAAPFRLLNYVAMISIVTILVWMATEDRKSSKASHSD